MRLLDVSSGAESLSQRGIARQSANLHRQATVDIMAAVSQHLSPRWIDDGGALFS